MTEKFRTWSDVKKSLSYVQDNPERFAIITALAKHGGKLNRKTYKDVSESLNVDIEIVAEIGDGIAEGLDN